MTRMEAERLLASLEEKIKTQIAYEFHDEEMQQEEFDNLTVPRLLSMLAYMFDGD